MRSKPDLARNRRGATQRRKTRRPGGKVLQRLFTYLGQRDPAFNNDVVATVAVPKAVRPNYALTKQALQMKPVTAASAKRTRRRPAAAKSYAASIAKAAEKLSRGHRGKPKRRAAKGSHFGAPPPGVPGVWQEIGPTRVPE